MKGNLIKTQLCECHGMGLMKLMKLMKPMVPPQTLTWAPQPQRRQKHATNSPLMAQLPPGGALRVLQLAPGQLSV